MENFCKICGAKYIGVKNCIDMYNELLIYTLSHHDQKFFIHQYVVDAYAAQHASENKKTIKTAFALIGLCLSINYNYTGKEVQNAHIELAKNKKKWPTFAQPKEMAKITVADVIAVAPGNDRDEMIKKWASAVWDMWEDRHAEVLKLVLPYLAIHNNKKYENN